MNLSHIIQLSYGIPGVLAYFLVAYGMHGVRKELNSSFIVIFMLTAVINIATWLNTWPNHRLQNENFFFFFYEWINEHLEIAKIAGLAIFQFYFAQNICLLLLTMDRFFVILSVTRNTMWWHRYYLPISIIAQLLCLGLNLVVRLPIHLVYVFNSEKGQYNVYYDPSLNCNMDRAEVFQLFFGAGTFVVCSVLNITSFKQIVQIRRQVSMSKEVSFFLICFCIFLAQVVNLFLVASMAVVNYIGSVDDASVHAFFYFANKVMFFTSDLFSIGPAYYTLLLPSPIRRFVWRKMKERIRHYAESTATRFRSSSD